ncbi:TonB family protein [Mucilaginibacter terrae]|uniref:energy transducer TonB n=1 Tax=Mucilaginibacter terrae TaxID=1955052 RepID=UPI003633CC07
MRLFFAFIAAFLAGSIAYAQTQENKSEVKKTTENQEPLAIQKIPSYPGGINAFNKMILSNLKYPELAQLIGISGRVVVSFVVDTTGHLSNITPLNCIGAGCESEAVKAISMSKVWLPGMQDDKLVRVQYSVPIAFNANKSKVSFKELRKSKYGFMFEINGTEYAIDDAEKQLGKTFPSSQIEISMPYLEADKFPEFSGKEVILSR